MKMIMVASGSRKVKNRKFVFDTLDVLSKIMTFEKFYLGDAVGADAIFLQYCKERGIEYDVSEAYWDAFGLGAGPRRNKEMLDKAEAEGKKITLVAFPHRGPEEQSKGTWNTIQQARERRDIRIFVFPTD